MVIVQEQTLPVRPNYTKAFIFVGILLGTSLVGVPLLSALASDEQPTGTYLSPLPEGQLTAMNDTIRANSTNLTTQQAILSAQAFLEKAVQVSKKAPQTDDDKNQIISLLNQGLDLANQAVVLSPQSPQSYLMRARILSSSVGLRTDATQLAQKDLEFAQSLANGQSVTLPTNIDLFKMTPTEQAGIKNNIVIAAPEEDNTKTNTGNSSSNTIKSNSQIIAGALETTINHQGVSESSYIYLIPKSKDHVIFVKSKSSGSFTVATNDSSTTDIQFEYWIVNQPQTTP
jgi:hypothetical protein